MMSEDEPRAYTEDEVRDMIIEGARQAARYWAALPDVDAIDGRARTIQDRCDGVAFSILTMLDGCGVTLPALTLKLDPHESDKAFLAEEGENWFEPGMEISTSLHEFYDKPPNLRTTP